NIPEHALINPRFGTPEPFRWNVFCHKNQSLPDLLGCGTTQSYLHCMSKGQKCGKFIPHLGTKALFRG
ncbi:MAG: hypothetical protein ACNA70_04810, partial [Brevefilum sp.]